MPSLPTASNTARSNGRSRLGLLLIKPSQYDDDGYVIQWWRSYIVTNALAVVSSLFRDAADRQALGPDVAIETRLIDEVVQIVRPAELKRWLADFDYAAVLLVAVQTSQFPRALAIGSDFRAAGFPVIVGGVHVSGTYAMTPNWEAGFAGVQEAGVSLFAGELEPHVDELLTDIVNGTVKPFYNHLAANADLGTAPRQRATHDLAARTFDRYYGLEIGRGCPFVCSFCTIINFHGRVMRHRTLADIEAYLRECAAGDGRTILITDDNFARSPIWRDVCAIFTRLRQELGVDWDVSIQVDALAVRIDGFVEACQEAGVKRIFLGMESVRADNLKAAGKGQNKVHQLRDMVMTWRRAGVIIYAGMIVGLPNDTPERIAEDVRVLQDEIPVDILSPFLYTPLPGSADHKRMVAEGVEMDTDLNRYETVHTVIDHPLMSRPVWQQLYWDTWSMFYTWPYLRTTIARGLKYGLLMTALRSTYVCSFTAASFEKVHSGNSGAFRFRDRSSRRAGFPTEPAIPHAIRQLARNGWILARIGARLLFAYGLELFLRWERSRGRLDRYLGEEPSAGPMPEPDGLKQGTIAAE
jgi:radical SAM superfamily enzyme YgiQ (UPF0313 family)